MNDGAISTKSAVQNPKDFERWFTNGLKGEQSNKVYCGVIFNRFTVRKQKCQNVQT